MIRRIILITIIGLFYFTGYGEEKYILGLSVANNVVNVGKKSRLSGGENETESGKLISENSIGVIIGASSSFNSFMDSNFGYYNNIAYESFEVNKQVIPRAEKQKKLDLGTSIDGYTLNVTPIFVYNINFLKSQNIYLGVGLGLGYINLDGDIYMTENTEDANCANSNTVDTLKQNCDKNDVSVSEFTYSLGWAFGYEGETFGTKIKRTAPQLKKTDTAYTIWTLSWDIYFFF
jgi:hypothetical protein